MTALQLPRHSGLSATTRLRLLISDTTIAPAADWMLLITCGALAAFASTCIDLQIRRIPGHAILRVVFPIALGLALVPRRGAGTVMGASGLITAMILRLSGLKGEGLGFGALTSLLATGPLLDFTLRRSSGGRKQYAAFAVAGLASSLMALLTRGTAKALGWERGGAGHLRTRHARMVCRRQRPWTVHYSGRSAGRHRIWKTVSAGNRNAAGGPRPCDFTPSRFEGAGRNGRGSIGALAAVGLAVTGNERRLVILDPVSIDEGRQTLYEATWLSAIGRLLLSFVTAT